jgi:glutamate--cysteine ligase
LNSHDNPPDASAVSLQSFIDAAGSQGNLLHFNLGIEREALRVTPEGNLAQTPHPAFLGSKLTHPKITTDFSESQLELITPVHNSVTEALKDLSAVHRFIYSGLEEEILWSASMPCVLQSDDSIPLAYYGESNPGRLKTTYRNGLGYRYGRGMQTICAVHYNFSFSDVFWHWLKELEGSTESIKNFSTRRYFDLMRNFRRYSWLLIYLFGASPAVCNSFIRGKNHGLQPFDEGTSYLPGATSLRSGNLGYQSDAQSANLQICYNSLESYIGTLADAVCEPYETYERIGVHVDDEYRQVNTSILQSEAEFYSSIRAKRVPAAGENFLACLLEDGVQYIEVRLLDVNPYLPLGIDESEMRFLNTFLLYCLLEESPQHDDQLCSEVDENLGRAVRAGREDHLMLMDQGSERNLRQWGQDLLGNIAPLANLLDDRVESGHSVALETQSSRLGNPDLTPSGSILSELQENGMPFFSFAMRQALAHRDLFLSQPPSDSELAEFRTMTEASIAAQSAIEAHDHGSFDDYLESIAAAYRPLRHNP